MFQVTHRDVADTQPDTSKLVQKQQGPDVPQ
jgi:hypothetical protein